MAKKTVSASRYARMVKQANAVRKAGGRVKGGVLRTAKGNVASAPK